MIDPACYAPSHALTSARILRDVAPSYAVVSTVTAHSQWPAQPVSSSSPVYETGITQGPSDDLELYGRLKAGVERAVETIFGEINTLVVRPGVVLGPHEDLGRLPDYLRRASRGDFVVGGDPAQAFQYVDSRDLADFILTCAETGRPGRYDVVTRTGEYTWGDFAQAVAEVAGGKPVFVEDERLLAAGVTPWRGLPLWSPQGPMSRAVVGRRIGRLRIRILGPPAARHRGGHVEVAAERRPGLDPFVAGGRVRNRSRGREAVDRQHRLNAAAHTQRSATCRISPAMSSPGKRSHPRNSARCDSFVPR